MAIKCIFVCIGTIFSWEKWNVVYGRARTEFTAQLLLSEAARKKEKERLQGGLNMTHGLRVVQGPKIVFALKNGGQKAERGAVVIQGSHWDGRRITSGLHLWI